MNKVSHFVSWQYFFVNHKVDVSVKNKFKKIPTFCVSIASYNINLNSDYFEDDYIFYSPTFYNFSFLIMLKGNVMAKLMISKMCNVSVNTNIFA